MEELKALRWRSGKEAVNAVTDVALQQGKCARVATKGGTFRRVVWSSADTGCDWSASLSRLRSKSGPGDWHVTEANLNHVNCTGIAKPSRHQLEVNAVVCATLVTDPSTSAQALVTQVQHQKGIPALRHVMYRAKENVTARIFSENETTVELLPSFLAEFQRLNPGTFTELQRDDKNRFQRAIVVLKPQWFLKGQGLYGIDAAHMKHRKYNGVQIILVSRDGNFNNEIAAVAVAPVEDNGNYNWFFSRVIEHGFPLKECPVFSDRHHGLVSAAHEHQVFNMFCIHHLIGNMQADKTIRLAVSQDRFVWQTNAATCEADFLVALNELKNINKPAADYLIAISATKWTLYPYFNKTPLYGWRTTNFVESEQAKSLRLKPRMMLPFKYFKSYATIIMRECYARVKQSHTWAEKGRIVTRCAESKFQEQLKKTGDYTAISSSEHVAFVANVRYLLKQRLVDINQPDCSCATWKQQLITCRHLMSAMIAQGASQRALQLVGDCFEVSTYIEGTRTLEVPEDSALTRDKTIHPAPFVRQAGRPRKRRLRVRGEVGGKARQPYKCGRCGKSDGHNRATCRIPPS